MISRLLERFAIRTLGKRRDRNVPTDARLYWVWDETTVVMASGEERYETTPMASPAYEGRAPTLTEWSTP